MSREEGGRSSLECPRVEHLLMEADPAELRGEGEGRLALHLRECEACRRRAGRLARGTTLLDATLEVSAEHRSLEEILERVHEEVDAAGAQAPRPTTRRSRRRATLWRVVLPLAAAAVVAVLALWPRGPVGGPTPGGAPAGWEGAVGLAPQTLGSRLTQARGATGVRVAADARFALMETDEPTISVVWFY